MGLPFEQAWAWALDCVTLDGDWRNPVPGRHGVESVASFARRHFMAAYTGTEAGRYCQGPNCTRLLPPGRRWCPKHEGMEGEHADAELTAA